MNFLSAGSFASHNSHHHGRLCHNFLILQDSGMANWHYDFPLHPNPFYYFAVGSAVFLLGTGVLLSVWLHINSPFQQKIYLANFHLACNDPPYQVVASIGALHTPIKSVLLVVFPFNPFQSLCTTPCKSVHLKLGGGSTPIITI
jgi:hypothetical protein